MKVVRDLPLVISEYVFQLSFDLLIPLHFRNGNSYLRKKPNIAMRKIRFEENYFLGHRTSRTRGFVIKPPGSKPPDGSPAASHPQGKPDGNTIKQKRP